MALGIQTALAGDFTQLSTTQAIERNKIDGIIFVDARDPNAFNGWPMQGEKNGGHIPGATNLAASWITRNLPRTAEVTAEKHLKKAKGVVVYGYDAGQAETVAQWLTVQGVPSECIKIYPEGFRAWEAAGKSVERLPHYELIVPAQWLKKQMAKKTVKVVEASWGKGEKYEKAHIPGAIHLNTDLLESDARHWNYLPPAELERNLISLGITADTPVVLYGEYGIDAARAAVAMMYIGVKDVRLLNGGLDAWKSAGYGTTSGMVSPAPANSFGASTPQHPELVINIPDAKRILADDNAVLISIRSWTEYIGETSGYSYIKPKGRIKGAVWGHGGKDSYNMDHFRNPDNTMRDYTEITTFWKKWGITPDKETAFHCGTGWRASEALIDAMAMGYEKAHLFDDGWYIWSMNPANPTANGDPR